VEEVLLSSGGVETPVLSGAIAVAVMIAVEVSVIVTIAPSIGAGRGRGEPSVTGKRSAKATRNERCNILMLKRTTDD
jgi:hypothetical protein